MSDDPDLNRQIYGAIQMPDVHDQHTLLSALAQSGHQLSQSTLSRKLKQLGIHKRDGRFVLSNASKTGLLQVVLVPPNLLVLKTEPGFAQALAAKLDRFPLPGQVGTVAGDDTVFVAVQAIELAKAGDAARLL